MFEIDGGHNRTDIREGGRENWTTRPYQWFRGWEGRKIGLPDSDVFNSNKTILFFQKIHKPKFLIDQICKRWFWYRHGIHRLPFLQCFVVTFDFLWVYKDIQLSFIFFFIYFCILLLFLLGKEVDGEGSVDGYYGWWWGAWFFYVIWANYWSLVCLIAKYHDN